MYDLDTIKRINRAPSKRNERDNPAPQPTRYESENYCHTARAAVLRQRYNMQSPAMDREALDRWLVVDEEAEGHPTIAVFSSLKDAETYIGGLPDVHKVARGGYGIDGPAE
jgi:hypothetical protein